MTITNKQKENKEYDKKTNRSIKKKQYLFNGTKNVKQVDTDVETVFIPTCFTSLYTEIERNAIIY